MKFTAVVITIFFAVLNANAASVSDTIIIKSDNSSERIARDLDSLVSTWYVKIAIKNNLKEYLGDSIGLQCPDTVYESRLNKINSIIRLPFNDIIRNHIEVYTIRQGKIQRSSGAERLLFPHDRRRIRLLWASG